MLQTVSSAVELIDSKIKRECGRKSSVSLALEGRLDLAGLSRMRTVVRKDASMPLRLCKGAQETLLRSETGERAREFHKRHREDFED